MNFKDLFKKKKTEYNDEQINLNDDIYIDEEMKTFNPETEAYDPTLTNLDTTMVSQGEQNPGHTQMVRQAVIEQLKAEQNIKPDFMPLTYNEIKKAAEKLQRFGQLVLSVEKMSSEDRSKTLNFFAGMIYALDGSFEHYSKNIYIFHSTN